MNPQSILKSTAALLATYFHPGFLLGVFFDPEDGEDMFLRNVGVTSQKIVLFNFKNGLQEMKTTVENVRF
jgi:hypothetical protein